MAPQARHLRVVYFAETVKHVFLTQDLANAETEGPVWPPGELAVPEEFLTLRS